MILRPAPRGVGQCTKVGKSITETLVFIAFSSRFLPLVIGAALRHDLMVDAHVDRLVLLLSTCGVLLVLS